MKLLWLILLAYILHASYVLNQGVRKRVSNAARLQLMRQYSAYKRYKVQQQQAKVTQIVDEDDATTQNGAKRLIKNNRAFNQRKTLLFPNNRRVSNLPNSRRVNNLQNVRRHQKQQKDHPNFHSAQSFLHNLAIQFPLGLTSTKKKNISLVLTNPHPDESLIESLDPLYLLNPSKPKNSLKHSSTNKTAASIGNKNTTKVINKTRIINENVKENTRLKAPLKIIAENKTTSVLKDDDALTLSNDTSVEFYNHTSDALNVTTAVEDYDSLIFTKFHNNSSTVDNTEAVQHDNKALASIKNENVNVKNITSKLFPNHILNNTFYNESTNYHKVLLKMLEKEQLQMKLLEQQQVVDMLEQEYQEQQNQQLQQQQSVIQHQQQHQQQLMDQLNPPQPQNLLESLNPPGYQPQNEYPAANNILPQNSLTPAPPYSSSTISNHTSNKTNDVLNNNKTNYVFSNDINKTRYFFNNNSTRQFNNASSKAVPSLVFRNLTSSVGIPSNLSLSQQSGKQENSTKTRMIDTSPSSSARILRNSTLPTATLLANATSQHHNKRHHKRHHKQHPVILLAKLASDFGKSTVVENVVKALGIDDILNFADDKESSDDAADEIFDGKKKSTRKKKWHHHKNMKADNGTLSNTDNPVIDD